MWQIMRERRQVFLIRLEAWRHSRRCVVSGGRLFQVPVHAKPGRCAGKLKAQWWLATYTTVIATFIYIVALVAVTFGFHLTHTSYAWIFAPSIFLVVLGNVVGIAFSIWFGLFMRPNVWIEEVDSNQLLGTKNYKFTLADASYAQEFKELNSSLLAGSE